MGFISSENHMWSSKTAYIPCLLLFYEEDIEVSFFFPTTKVMSCSS